MIASGILASRFGFVILQHLTSTRKKLLQEVSTCWNLLLLDTITCLQPFSSLSVTEPESQQTVVLSIQQTLVQWQILFKLL